MGNNQTYKVNKVFKYSVNSNNCVPFKYFDSPNTFVETNNFVSFISSEDSFIGYSTHSFVIHSSGATVSNLEKTGVVLLENFTATMSNTLYTPNLNVQGTINIQNVIQLNPLTSDPVTASKGTIYYHDTLGPRFYDGTTWRQINFT